MAEEPRLKGQILDVPPAPRRIHGSGDMDLANYRGRLYRSWLRESTELKRPLLVMSDELTIRLSELGLDPTGKTLTADSVLQMDAMTRALINDTYGAVEAEIEIGVRRAISRAQRAQINQLEKLGVKSPSRAIRRQIRQEVFDLLDEEFPPGSGQTFRTRMAAHKIVRAKALKNAVRRGHQNQTLERISADVNDSLTHSRPGKTPVPGGSAYKQSRRMMIAEETRLSNEVERRTLLSAGVSFAYWRLNPAHRWYGGKEICEFYASWKYPSTERMLADNPLVLDTNGLYPLTEYPQYPHPYCKCYMDPYVPPGHTIQPVPELGLTGSAALSTLAFVGVAVAAGVLLSEDEES